MQNLFVYIIKVTSAPQIIQLQPQQMTSQSAPPGGIQVNKFCFIKAIETFLFGKYLI